MQDLVACYHHEPPSPTNLAIVYEAQCQADHVLTYLNTMVDDVAQLIILGTGVASPKQRIESMGDLKHPAVAVLPALAPVNAILVELENAGSWWDLGFKPKKCTHTVAYTQSVPRGLPGLVACRAKPSKLTLC